MPGRLRNAIGTWTYGPLPVDEAWERCKRVRLSRSRHLQFAETRHLLQDLAQAFNGPQIAAAGAGLGQSQHLGDLAGAELLEVLERQHFAVEGVHAVERFLNVNALLGLDGGLRGRR